MNVDNIVVNTQSSIKLVLDKVVYFDPYKIEEEKYLFKDGRLASIKNGYGTAEFEYNEQGKLLRKYDSLSCNTTYFNLNENGQLVSISSSNSKVLSTFLSS